MDRTNSHLVSIILADRSRRRSVFAASMLLHCIIWQNRKRYTTDTVQE